MKLLKTLFLSAIAAFTFSTVSGQANASINILTLNGGIVNVGGTVDVQVTVGNTGPVSSIGVNKVRAQISIPVAIANAAPNAEQTGLPAGWIILSNTGGVITVCNGTDVIPVGAQRQVFIKLQGHTAGGPSTVSGQLSFGPGTAVCTGLGSLSGDLPADNSSQSTITVSIVTPVKLTQFSARLVNCQPVLDWKTEDEINLERFEIERAELNNSGWIMIGTVAGKATASGKSEYNFIDQHTGTSPGEWGYRLKMIDKDGRYQYSSILRVAVICYTTQINAYPNPVQNGKLYVTITGAARFAEAILQSASGQVILKTKMNIGTNYLDVSAVPNGVYILKVEDENGSKKMIKIVIGQ